MCNTNLKLMKLDDELYKSALFFNKIMGGKNLVDDRGGLLFAKSELAEKINRQYLIALEELKETETALNVNLTPVIKIRDKVMNNSILFNKIVNGKGVEDYSKWELVSKINAQYLIAKEEVDEFFTAKENNDIVEMYDGAIDTFYTVPFLVQLLNEYEVRYDTEYDECDGYTLAELDILEQGGVDVLFESTELDLDILSEYADRVIENNMQKFTTSLEEFKTWESDYIPTSKEYDGKLYYFFVDENGKIKKRIGFPKVEVEGLFNGTK